VISVTTSRASTTATTWASMMRENNVFMTLSCLSCKHLFKHCRKTPTFLHNCFHIVSQNSSCKPDFAAPTRLLN